MSDTLSSLHKKFLDKLKDGMDEYDICTEIGVSFDWVEEEEKTNAAFANALVLMRSGVMAVKVTPKDLGMILESQVNDEMAAAYFCMNINEFNEAINSDKQLKRIYDTARNRGKAKMMVSAYSTGLAGDAKMQEHFLHFHNDMKKGADNNTNVEVKVNLIDSVESAANVIAFLEQAKGLNKEQAVIEVDNEETIELVIDDATGKYVPKK